MFSINNESSDGITGPRSDDSVFCAADQLIDLLVNADEQPDAAAISTELRQILPHEFFAYAQLSAYDGRILRLVNISFPPMALTAFGIVDETRDCALIKAWFTKRAPVCVDPRGRVLAEAEWGSAPKADDSAVPLLFHAQLDPTGTRGMGFCFGVVPRSVLPRCGAILRFVTPYLYARLARRFWAPVPANAARLLTPREIQVIEWMYYGKTNEEIATLLGNSVYTVKNHVQRILLKLSATNRTQAVLRAVDAGLVKYSDANGPKTD
jgi:DNA-binding CsgD family transcriptional regulator